MPAQKQLIESIKNKQLNSDKEFVLDSLTGAIDRIQKAFPRYGSFLMEFVQNADDANSKSLGIELTEATIKILNDGDPFSEEDVKSLCKVGRSSKTAKDYIGYLGVGFKAVFLISESPEINSGGFKFKFDRSACDDPSHMPWQIIPLWVDKPQVEVLQEINTVFNLPLKEEKLLEKMKDEIRSEHLNNRILLFLRNIKKIEIIDHTDNRRRTLVREISSKTRDYEIYEVNETNEFENTVSETKDRWLVFRSLCKVPEEIKEDYMTKEWERNKLETREVVAAFRLDEKDSLMEEEEGTAHIGVFSFLPLKELPSGLNFLIQADFLTTPGRGELARECAWNNWLAEEIRKLVITKGIPIFLSNEKWKMTFTEVLYSSEGGHELFETNIKKPLRDYLRESPILIAEDGSMIKPEEAISLTSESKKILNHNDIKALYPEKKALHPDCTFPWHIGQLVENEPRFNATSGSSSKMADLIQQKSQNSDQAVEFFIKFYREYLLGYSRSTIRKLRSHSIILTENYGLADAHSVYIKSKDLIIPPELEKSFETVHPGLAEEIDVLEFLKALGIDELTNEHVQSVLKTQEIPKISMGWSNFSNQEKIGKIGFCKDLWEKNNVSVKDLSFLTLRTTMGDWLKPEEMIFPGDYQPDHNIELLQKKGLVDFPMKFVSLEFIKNENVDEVRNWSEFFKELGVDKRIEREKSRIVQRIGVLTALKYEKKNRRKARELGESETPGYDIKSKGRFIEVKSSSKVNPDISITTNELSALREKQEKYFVYVVRQALSNPSLCVTRGDKLLQITDIRTIIPFSKWWDNTKEEEFEP
ncbi:MAG: sacsin N-terminal ATP-binding-like domain-containing protein [Candidatus Heimdallarchaeota archaeon]